MILISFEHLQKILIFPKFQGCNSKIVPAMPFWILKFKWAWQTQFLSHNLVTLKNYVFFKDLQMILVPFFHIPTGFQLRKNGFQSSVHILRRRWPIGTCFNMYESKVITGPRENLHEQRDHEEGFSVFTTIRNFQDLRPCFPMD